MNVYDRFEKAFNCLFTHIETKDFQAILRIENLYQDLGSISNIEMYYYPKTDLILNLSDEYQKELVYILTDLDKLHFSNREKDWYFANLFSMIFITIYNSLKNENRQIILDYVLSNRKNERIPFAKDLDLNINSYQKFNEFPLKKFKVYQDKWNEQ